MGSLYQVFSQTGELTPHTFPPSLQISPLSSALKSATPRLGRKRLMFLSLALAAASTLASAFVTDYTVFLALRVAMGVATLGTFLTMCILAVEITGTRSRQGQKAGGRSREAGGRRQEA